MLTKARISVDGATFWSAVNPELTLPWEAFTTWLEFGREEGPLPLPHPREEFGREEASPPTSSGVASNTG